MPPGGWWRDSSVSVVVAMAKRPATAPSAGLGIPRASSPDHCRSFNRPNTMTLGQTATDWYRSATARVRRRSSVVGHYLLAVAAVYAVLVVHLYSIPLLVAPGRFLGHHLEFLLDVPVLDPNVVAVFLVAFPLYLLIVAVVRRAPWTLVTDPGGADL